MTAKETKHKKRRPKKFVRITLNIITVLLVLTFIGLNVYLGYKILDKKEIEDKVDPIIVESDTKKVSSTLENEWQQGKIKYIFKDKTFTYYDAEKSYYEGTYTFLQGDKALEEMGYTEEDLEEQFGNIVDENTVYSIQLMPTKRIVKKQDQSKIIKAGTKWWLIVVIKDDNTIIGFNKTLDKRYELKRVAK